LKLSQRRAGFAVLARDIDEVAAVAAVWLVQAGSGGSTQYALQFERVDSWRCLGWSRGPARDLSPTRRPSAAGAPASAIELLTSGSSRSLLDRERQVAGHGDVADVGWVACAGFRVAAGSEALEVGERLIRVPDHGYVVVAWRSPATLVRPTMRALRKDGSPLAVIRPNEHMDDLGWKSILTVLDDERPPG
jgi:hypothetical protein